LPGGDTSLTGGLRPARDRATLRQMPAIPLRDIRAEALPDLDKALGGQEIRGLAYRGAADLVLRDEIELGGQPVTGTPFAGVDAAAQVFEDLDVAVLGASWHAPHFTVNHDLSIVAYV
jgi:hypothetical protein